MRRTMGRKVKMSCIAAIPLTALTEWTKYLVQDWEFAKWIAVLVVVDTVLGMVKHIIRKDLSSEDFWGGFAKKIFVYIVLMILSNVLASYTVGGEAVGATSWMSRYLCIFMVVREAISILENTNAIYPILPKGLIKRFRDFGEKGEYIKPEDYDTDK